jgi:hypothetical protein
MNYLFIINTFFGLYNYVIDTSVRLVAVTTAIYRVCTSNNVWYITSGGQFTDDGTMNISDAGACWKYDGQTLFFGDKIVSKKLPFLSVEFKRDGSLVNMDDFVENTRYMAPSVPPLPVVMAAFCIRSKTLYTWLDATFTVYNKMGDTAEFAGADGKFPDDM